MSDTIVNQTREQATAPPQYALRVIGTGRMAWQWEGRCYTATGVLVPNDVIREDDALINDGLPLPPDVEVLDMVVTLPENALPPGAFITPLDGSQPKQQRPAAEDAAALKARIKELEDQNAALVREASTSPAKSKDDIDAVLATGKQNAAPAKPAK